MPPNVTYKPVLLKFWCASVNIFPNMLVIFVLHCSFFMLSYVGIRKRRWVPLLQVSTIGVHIQYSQRWIIARRRRYPCTCSQRYTGVLVQKTLVIPRVLLTVAILNTTIWKILDEREIASNLCCTCWVVEKSRWHKTHFLYSHVHTIEWGRWLLPVGCDVSWSMWGR